jgi:hypothetical protein
VNDAAASKAQSLEPDGHGKRGANLQSGLGQRGDVAIDIAPVHGVTNFQEHQQDRKENGGSLHRTQGCVVASLPQEHASRPERQRRNAISPQ